MKIGDKYTNRRNRRRIEIASLNRVKGKPMIVIYLFGRTLDRWSALYLSDFKRNYKPA